MSPQQPDDPGLRLQPSRSAGPNPSPGFSNVQGHVDSVPDSARDPGAGAASGPGFANVQSHADSVPAATGSGGGGGGQTYTVQPGDTLSAIAHRIYGRASRWHALFDANRDQLDDPDLIRPGQVLKLPAADD